MADGKAGESASLRDEHGRLTASGFRRLGDVLETAALRSETCALVVEKEGRESASFALVFRRWREAMRSAAELLKECEPERTEEAERSRP